MWPRGSSIRTALWLSTFTIAVMGGLMPMGHRLAPLRAEAATSVPNLAKIRPCAAPSNRPANLTLIGSGFDRNASVRWLGAKTNFNLPTTFVSSAHLTAAISTSILRSSPNAGIVVINPHNRSSQERILAVSSAPASSCATGNSNRIDGTAVAVTGGASVVGHGAGTVAVTPLRSDPVAGATFPHPGHYFLLSIDLDSRFKSIDLVTRNMRPRNRLYWYNGSVWATVRGQHYKASGRIVLSITAKSSPSLHDLHNLASVSFGVGLPTTG